MQKTFIKCDECGTVYHSPDEIEYIEGNNGVCSDCEDHNYEYCCEDCDNGDG